jgi:hypothetical protein
MALIKMFPTGMQHRLPGIEEKRCELNWAVFDILNQNKSLARYYGDNYIQDVRSNVLKRYFMLSFTYNIRHGDKQQNNFQIPKQFQRNMKNLGLLISFSVIAVECFKLPRFH